MQLGHLTGIEAWDLGLIELGLSPETEITPAVVGVLARELGVDLAKFHPTAPTALWGRFIGWTGALGHALTEYWAPGSLFTPGLRATASAYRGSATPDVEREMWAVDDSIVSIAFENEPRSLVICVTDAQGRPRPGCAVEFLSNGGLLTEFTDSDGEAHFVELSSLDALDAALLHISPPRDTAGPPESEIHARVYSAVRSFVETRMREESRRFEALWGELEKLPLKVLEGLASGPAPVGGLAFGDGDPLLPVISVTSWYFGRAAEVSEKELIEEARRNGCSSAVSIALAEHLHRIAGRNG